MTNRETEEEDLLVLLLIDAASDIFLDFPFHLIMYGERITFCRAFLFSKYNMHDVKRILARAEHLYDHYTNDRLVYDHVMKTFSSPPLNE